MTTFTFDLGYNTRCYCQVDVEFDTREEFVDFLNGASREDLFSCAYDHKQGEETWDEFLDVAVIYPREITEDGEVDLSDLEVTFEDDLATANATIVYRDYFMALYDAARQIPEEERSDELKTALKAFSGEVANYVASKIK